MCLYYSFRPQIYIVFTGNHWYVLTNINVGCEKDIDTMEAYPESFANEWFIYDSLNDMMPQNLNAAGKIFKMIYPDEACKTVNCVNAIPQQNCNDCGLYAIAYAQCLMNGEDPAVRVFDHEKLRSEFTFFIECVSEYSASLGKFTSIAVPGFKRC
jgi:hypothetical protein